MNMTTTAVQREKLRRLMRLAAPGPWVEVERGNEQFLVLARNMLPDLLDDLDRWEAVLERTLDERDVLLARIENLKAMLADIHRQVGRGNKGTAEKNYECILGDLAMRSLEHAEEIAELKKKIVDLESGSS